MSWIGLYELADVIFELTYLILYQLAKFQCSIPLFSFSDVINFKIYLRTTSKAMADWEKKRGRWKYKNLNILRTKRAF